MYWFGGFSGPTDALVLPVGAHFPLREKENLWSVGPWFVDEEQTARDQVRQVAIFGPCGNTEAELHSLVANGVPDDVAYAWPGSYTVVELTSSGTTIWTDLGGACPIYVLERDGGAMWASSSRALAALTGQRIDWDRMAVYLVAPGITPLTDGRSMFADIRHIPAGHRLFLPRRGAPVCQRVWTPTPTARTVDLRTELASAVAVRLNSSAMPTADLSGGFDSTALCLLAAEQLQPDLTIRGVTVHPKGITSGGDMDYARVAANRPGIEHHLFPLDEKHAPYGRLENVPITDEPAPSTIAHSRFAAQLRWMQEAFGSDCHFTGDGGDALLCTPPVFLADLVRAGKIPRMYRDAVRWARVRRWKVGPLLNGAFGTARSDPRQALHRVAGVLAGGLPAKANNGGVSWYPQLPVPAWATKDTRAMASRLAREAAERTAPATSGPITPGYVADVMAEVGRTARADAQLAESYGIPLHNPFVDSRVINACLSLDLEGRPGPAEYKPLLRDALGDLLPGKLAGRLTKGCFNADHFAGLRAAQSTLLDLVDGRLADRGLVAPDRLRQTLAQAAAGLPVANACVDPVVSAEAWLLALDTAPAVKWTDAAPGNE
ncbi:MULTISPECIES: albusnodin/ikarugamycin family macrolactam cyclase [unclassified Crossiella]|uniref:albusnodin/ikarugamycin family macrolactam cyclase n=1 Tax=unclassified Crossiella TaxID=2620835 RepID=UPI0020004F41|nr:MULTISPECIES: albusnodin/ikarugamycin family macrolactam cyclase [unclassified Crossiella]MCK2239371.1 albusnodin/ikarugamycin family macrolactam cyclase [Crossiella sp. S99.2]MCK2252066.1 albusnodin/ikarugamycin family macrolactam cyclase [Crossiella sp. S99.1]